jgi:molybdopterin synthase sulfur carrier subunit
MKVKLLSFGITKEMVGSFEKNLELPSGTTVEGFLEILKNEYPALKKLTSLRVAVNEEYADNALEIMEKDEIVLVPPVSGG